jgi:hypothetical protein
MPSIQYLPDYIYEDGSVKIFDDGRFGTTVNPTDLYFIGGDKFASKTIA